MTTCFFVFVLEVLLLLHTKVCTDSKFSLKVELGPSHNLQCLLPDQFMSSKAVYIVFQFC